MLAKSSKSQPESPNLLWNIQILPGWSVMSSPFIGVTNGIRKNYEIMPAPIEFYQVKLKMAIAMSWY